jgi:hypothetical protein
VKPIKVSPISGTAEGVAMIYLCGQCRTEEHGTWRLRWRRRTQADDALAGDLAHRGFSRPRDRISELDPSHRIFLRPDVTLALPGYERVVLGSRDAVTPPARQPTPGSVPGVPGIAPQISLLA